MTTIHVDAVGTATADTIAERLSELCREACAENEHDADSAFEQWRDAVELEVELILRVLGADWQVYARQYFGKLRWRPSGKDLNEGSHTEDAHAKAAATRARRKAAIEVELGLLTRIMVGGKVLGACTKAELEAEAHRRRVKVMFLASIAELLPEAGSVVANFVTPIKAFELHQLAKKAS
jgi:hypothetical protein